jgi:hypothetical protein
VIRRPKRGLVLLIAGAAASSSGAPPARAAEGQPAPKVILLRPPTAPGPVGEALVRLRGELMIEGFDAQVVELTLGPDTRASLEKVAPTMAATAVVAVVAGADPGSAELWVVDRVTGKTVVRRIRADPSASAARTAEVLSVRAVELLRASFLELAITSRPIADAVDVPPLPPPPAVTRFATEPLADPDWTWAVEAGGGVMMAVSPPDGGVGNEFVPVARIERAFGPRWCGRVTFAGLGTQARVGTPGGYADVSQSVALADAVVRFRRGKRFEPIASLGAGALRLAAEGHLSAPYASGSGSRWSLAADAGVGFRVPIKERRFELGVEVHALVAEPYPVVHFFDQEVARAGRPSLLGSVTLLGGL